MDQLAYQQALQEKRVAGARAIGFLRGYRSLLPKPYRVLVDSILADYDATDEAERVAIEAPQREIA